MYIAKFVETISIIDPDTNGEVNLEVYKHPNGGMFAVDSSYLEQCTDEDTYPIILDPFVDVTGETENIVILSDLIEV